MITVLVTFTIPADISSKVLEEKFLETAPTYLETPGLIRKSYLYDRTTSEAGGCYTFEDLASAKAWFNEERIAWITDRYATPKLRYFETPVMVDKVAGQVDNPGW